MMEVVHALRVEARARDRIARPFPRLTHAEAMRRYGSDKPDLRFGLELVDVDELFAGSEFSLFGPRSSSAGGRDRRAALSGRRRAFAPRFRRADRDGEDSSARRAWSGSRSVPTAQNRPSRSSSTDATSRRCASATGAQDRRCAAALCRRARARRDRRRREACASEIGERCGLRDPEALAFCWVARFSVSRDGCSDRRHHVRAPPVHRARRPGQWELIDTDPLEMRAQHYDMVLNGYELGSGLDPQSRSGRTAAQDFENAGLCDRADRGALRVLRAKRCEYGAPPHGGMALGIDRIAMLACGEDEHPRSDRVPEEPDGARHDDGCAVRRFPQAVTGAGAGFDRDAETSPSLRTPRLEVEAEADVRARVGEVRGRVVAAVALCRPRMPRSA